MSSWGVFESVMRNNFQVTSEIFIVLERCDGLARFRSVHYGLASTMLFHSAHVSFRDRRSARLLGNSSFVYSVGRRQQLPYSISGTAHQSFRVAGRSDVNESVSWTDAQLDWLKDQLFSGSGRQRDELQAHESPRTVTLRERTAVFSAYEFRSGAGTT